MNPMQVYMYLAIYDCELVYNIENKISIFTDNVSKKSNVI